MASSRCLFAFDLDLPAGHSCRPHSHEATELVLSLGCRGRLHQGKSELEYADRTVFVYQPGKTHWIENVVAGRQTCVGVIGAATDELPPGVYPANDEIVQLFGEIQRRLVRSHRHDESRLDLLAGLVVLELAETVVGPRPDRTKAERVRDIIDTQFSMEWDVASLAREVYVSPDYLRQLFRAEYGEPVIHYLMQRRLEYARVLLSETNDSVAEIAHACGYQDAYYFSRVFRKNAGVSPSEYRAAHAER